MSDAIEIHNSLYGEKEDYIPQYLSEDWAYIPDFNNGDYTNQIQFSTETIKSKKIIWRDSYTVLPLNVQSSTATPYNGTTPVSVKRSVLDFIWGIQLNHIGGQQIINDTNITFINNLRLLLETNSDWLVSKGAEIHLSKDSVKNNQATTYASSIVAPYVSTVVQGPPVTVTTTDNPTFNAGFLDRITFLQTAATFNGTTNSFQFLCYLPLRLLHEIFNQLDMAIINSRFELYLLTSFGSNKSVKPFMVPAAIDPPNTSPNVLIGSANGINTCRLYYKYVEFMPADNEKYLAKLSRGLEYHREYLACETFTSIPNSQNLTNNTVIDNMVISSSLVQPVSLYVLAYPHGALADDNLPLAPIGRLTNVQLQINGENVYSNQFRTDWNFWEQLKQKFPAGESEVNGANISFYDFLTSQRIHYFDLSKAVHKLVAPNANVQLSFSGTLLAAAKAAGITNYDLVFLVEKAAKFVINVSSSQCTITRGTNI